MIHKSLKVFGKRGKKAVIKELKQLHDRTCFEPRLILELTVREKERAQQALLFLLEKRDGTVKGRNVFNGKPTREWLSREGAASPTVS